MPAMIQPAMIQPVMVLGCTSDAGKSFLVTGLCRAFANRGLRVAPFKAQNMSNNAAVTGDGLEIGRAQYVQALAARVEPDVRMNPILLKPVADTHSHVVLLGRPAPHLTALPWSQRRSQTWPVVADALHSLIADHDIVVIEGAGSPAEVNLRGSDIVNLPIMHEAQARAYLAVDIDRGGSFAHLLGTWMCLDPDDRARLAGFVLNRFRGDAALLGDGPAWLEERTGVPTVAVVPWIRHALPEEDRLIVRHADEHDRVGDVRIAIVAYPYASNLDEFDVLGWEPGVSVTLVRDRSRPEGVDTFEDFDAVILPGTRNTAASLDWMRSNGLDVAVTEAERRGVTILGVCGGMQLLGRTITDPTGIEGPAHVDGIGLLDLATVLEPEKQTRRTAVTMVATGLVAPGYEIHHGVTTAAAGTEVLLDQQRGWRRGSVFGVYVHGLLDDCGFRAWFLGLLGWSGPCRDWRTAFDAELDRVAGHLESTGLVDHALGSNSLHNTTSSRS